MKRKSPIRHQVRCYKREGKIVHSFLRGHGQTKHTNLIHPISRVKRIKDDFEEYKVTFHYTGNRKETIDMAANKPDVALEEAFKLRKCKGLKPIKIEIKDGIGNFLGSMVGKVAGSAHDAVSSYRTEYAKGVEERAKATEVLKEGAAKEKAFLESKAIEMVKRARKGDRTAQIYCDDNHIAWEPPIIT